MADAVRVQAAPPRQVPRSVKAIESRYRLVLAPLVKDAANLVGGTRAGVPASFASRKVVVGGPDKVVRVDRSELPTNGNVSENLASGTPSASLAANAQDESLKR